MPWLETSSVEQRERFIADERRGLYTRTAFCARYGISRKTGYVARPLPRGRTARPAGPEPCPASLSASHSGGHRRPGVRRAAPTPGLGARQAAGLARPAASRDRRGRMAGREYGRGPARPGGPGEGPAPTPPPSASRRRAATSGPPTSRGSSPPATGCGAIRSRSGINTRAICSRAGGFRTSRAGAPARFSSARSGSSACRGRCGRITGSPSPPVASMASRSSTSGGCGSASSISAFIPRHPRRTGPMNGCTGP